MEDLASGVFCFFNFFTAFSISHTLQNQKEQLLILETESQSQIQIYGVTFFYAYVILIYVFVKKDTIITISLCIFIHRKIIQLPYEFLYFSIEIFGIERKSI